MFVVTVVFPLHPSLMFEGKDVTESGKYTSLQTLRCFLLDFVKRVYHKTSYSCNLIHCIVGKYFVTVYLWASM